MNKLVKKAATFFSALFQDFALSFWISFLKVLFLQCQLILFHQAIRCVTGLCCTLYTLSSSEVSEGDFANS